jgi:hypothetical protein
MSTRIGRAAATVAIVVLSTSVVPGIAGAANGRPVGHDHGRHRHHHVPWLTAEQRQCLASQGLSARPGAARNPAARMAAWRAAFEVCGITFPPGRSPGSTTTTTTTTTDPPIEPN